MEVSKTVESSTYLEDTELRLGQPGTQAQLPNKRGYSHVVEERVSDDFNPPKKVQAIGWPPIRSYRKNNLKTTKQVEEEGTRAMYVKVSMDGSPILRKIDLKVYKEYKELLKGLEDMFNLKGMALLNKLTYEDKDGDWMLVGDVPWEMFITSCKKLRIIKGSQ